MSHLIDNRYTLHLLYKIHYSSRFSYKNSLFPTEMNGEARIWPSDAKLMQARQCSTISNVSGNTSSSSNINDIGVTTTTTNNNNMSRPNLELNDQIRSNYQKLNREILMRTQSYNSTPRPFGWSPRSNSSNNSMDNNDNSNHVSSSSSSSSTLKLLAPAEIKMHRQPQQAYAQYVTSLDRPKSRQAAAETTQQPSSNNNSNQQQQQQQPELIHKQYNSPLNLYSMDNIKKSIEAHTEMIKPGVKGINFMKPEHPINKESDLYKLIKQEEEQQSQARQKSSSPICGNLSASSSSFARISPVSGEPSMKISIDSRNNDDFKISPNNEMITSNSKITNECVPRNSLVCSECGLAIIGPYARVMERNIHAHCFNCTTCGTSLKNVGFFTINEKLYCDVHAKQVANVLHLNYDFVKTTRSEKELLEQQAPEPATQSVQQQQQQLLNDNIVKAKSQLTRQLPISNRSQDHQVKQPNLQKERSISCSKVPICTNCSQKITGPYVMAGQSTWCKPCSQNQFKCQTCNRSLLSTGFIEDTNNPGKHYCETCYESYFAPVCFNCNLKIKGDCLNALSKQWHPSCFVCGHCRRPFGNSSFYLEDDVAYCERDWNLLFTTKCVNCGLAIEAGDKWIEALEKNYHANCFKCNSCKMSLEGSVFYCRNGEIYCRLHAR